MTSGLFPATSTKPPPTRTAPQNQNRTCSAGRSRIGRLVLLLLAATAITAPALLGAASASAASVVSSETISAGGPDVLAAADDPILPPAQQQPEPGPNRAPADQSTPADQPGLDLGTGEIFGFIALGLVSLMLAGVAMTTLAWMLHAWRSPQTLAATGFSRAPRTPQRSFSLLVPARHEEEVLGDTLDALAELDHPDYEVIAIIGHDDPGTERVARAAADRNPDIVRVVIDHSVPKNKPKGLNTALPECRGDVVGVFDAEDEVHPQLLRLVDARFVDTGADVVQGGVQLMNLHTSWWSLRNCMEYYFWFRSRLHFHANARFIPLGGNTVFVRTDLLRAAEGWDAECLAEDCELGVRLSTQGAKVVVAYDPEVVTREETPPTLTSLYKQRTRWNQGFLQVLRKGEWRKLPTRRQRVMARYLLAMPFLQAFTGLMIPVSIVLILTVKVPTIVALATFLPIVPTLLTLVVETAGLGDFGRMYGVKIRLRDYLRLLVGTFPYQVFLAAAAVRSVIRELRGINAWEKTEHTNAHRSTADPAAVAPVMPAVERPRTELVPAGGAESQR